MEMPPHHHSQEENQELRLAIRKGSSQARKRLLHPDPVLGLLTARRFSRRKGGKKGGGGGKKAEWDHHEFGKNEAHPLGR